LSNRVEPEIPTINIDQDQVKMAREPVAKAHKSEQVNSATNTPKTLTAAQTLLILIPYFALAATGWYFYQQQVSVNNTLASSSARIQQLENQLSATGEEIGESTIALKVKLEAVSEKTELLLSEMDKLWASAWRRNQEEIKALNSKSINMAQQQNKNTSSVSQQNNALNDLKDKITATEFSINAVSEQMVTASSLKEQFKKLSAQFNTLDANAKSRDKQQMFTATSINQFDTSLQLLVERMERLEAILASKSGP
jgi:chromosome segregation ATPase